MFARSYGEGLHFVNINDEIGNRFSVHRIGDPALALDFARVIHGGQEYEYLRPLVEGETLSVRARIESIRVRGGSGFLTVAMDLVGADGRIAARARSTLIERAPD